MRHRCKRAAWCALLLTCLCGAAGGSLAATAAAADGVGAAASGASGASDGLRPLHRGTPHDALFGIAFDGARGVAVGAFGSVLASQDGGARWERQATPPLRGIALLAVAIQSGHCIAVGQMGTVLTSADCKTWQLSPAVTKSRLLGVAVNAQGVAYAVGGFGTILRSADWGKTWAVQEVDWKPFTTEGAEPHLYDVHVAKDGTPTIVGEFELILRANAGGTQWKTLHKGERSLFGMTVLDDGRAYTVGQSGAVLASTDGGATWRSLSSGTEAILTGIYAGPKGQVLASGINTLLVSKDDGASWSQLTSKLAMNGRHQALGAGVSDGKSRVVVVGSGGSILEIDP